MPELVVELLEILLPLVALALAYMASAILKPIVSLIGAVVGGITDAINWVLGTSLNLVGPWTVSVGQYFEQYGGQLAKFFSGLGQASKWTTHAIWRTTQTMHDSMVWLVDNFIPGQIAKQTAHLATKKEVGVLRLGPTTSIAALKKAQRAQSLQAAVDAALPGWITKDAGDVQWLARSRKALAAALAVAGGFALPHPGLAPRTRQEPYGQTVKGILRRLRSVEGKLTRVGAIALVIGALDAIGGSWLKCPPWKQNSRNLCRVNAGWLEQFLLGGIAVVGGLSLLTFAHYMQEGVEDGWKVIKAFWRVEKIPDVGGQTFGSGGIAEPVRAPGFGTA